MPDGRSSAVLRLKHFGRHIRQTVSQACEVGYAQSKLRIADLRSRYPTLSEYLLQEYSQDFEFVHGNAKAGMKNYIGKNKDKRQDLHQEIRSFRQEFRKDECAVAAWQALGGTIGTTAQFVLKSLNDSEGEVGSSL